MNADEINRKLKDNYGVDLLGNQKFRVVWSEDQTEKRLVTSYREGEFIVNLDKPKAVIVPKYNYVSERFILEKLEYNNNPELTEKFTYEPLFVFQDGNKNFLPLNWEAIRLIINAIENRVTVKKTDKQVWDEEQEDLQKEIKRNLDYLNATGRSDLQQKLSMKEAVSMSGPKMEKSNE